MLEAKTIKRCASACLFFVVSIILCAQPAHHQHRVIFYNCENFFDPNDDPAKQDNDYTPEGDRHWTSFRQYEKSLNISKAIVAAGEGRPPMLIGLAEVENDSVMDRLAYGTPLRSWEYKYVITHCDDARGINVALMYQPLDFRLLGSKSVKIEMPVGSKPTRDLLHVWGRMVNSDTLDVIVCHLPSRLGGVVQSNRNRMAAHRVLRHLVDSIQMCRQHPRILIMGDMNEAPNARILEKTMKFGKDIYNLMLPLNKELMMGKRSFGSHKYHGKWSFLDQFWVNDGLIKKENPDMKNNVWIDHVDVVHFPFMLAEDNTHLGHRPLRSYYGFKYEAGFSDHLPIMSDLHICY